MIPDCYGNLMGPPTPGTPHSVEAVFNVEDLSGPNGSFVGRGFLGIGKSSFF